MKDWILGLLVQMILRAVTEKKIDRLADYVKSFLVPYLREQKDELMDRLKAAAAQTDTPIDDAVYHAIGVFLDNFIPKEDAIEQFASVSRRQSGGTAEALA